MTLYYNTDTFELRDFSDSFMEELRTNGNPKFNQWTIAPPRPTEDHYWSSGSWVAPNAAVPPTVSARQVRIWLIQNGISLSSVEASINNIEDPILKEITKVEWEYAPYIERNHPMLATLAQALGLTQEQLDQAFIQAQNI